LEYQTKSITTFAQYIDSGYFCDSYSLNNGNNDAVDMESNVVVLKSLRCIHVVDPYNIHMINNEAVVMDGLTSSNTILTMYEHCGSFIAVEHGFEIYDTVVPNRDNGKRIWNSVGRIKQNELENLQKQHNDIFPVNHIIIMFAHSLIYHFRNTLLLLNRCLSKNYLSLLLLLVNGTTRTLSTSTRTSTWTMDIHYSQRRKK
jgi:hypothetical protein